MVGVRIFLIFIFGVLLISASAYALMVIEGDMYNEEGAISAEAAKEIESIKTEKAGLIKDAAVAAEERKKNLKPFVYTAEEIGADAADSISSEASGPKPASPFRDTAVIPAQAGVKASKRQGAASNPLLNLMFFSVLIVSFLAAYFLIRPKSK